MHYVRFLKPPRVAPDGSSALTAKITVTTDLGEAFLAVDVDLIVELEYVTGKAGIGSRKQYTWRGATGMRALEVVVPIAPRSPAVKLLVRPKDKKYEVDNFEAILQNLEIDEDLDDQGSIVAVRSMPVDVTGQSKATPGLAERVFGTVTGKKETKLHIWEETGESIARHIWDAGLVLSSYLATLPYRTQPAQESVLKFPRLQLLDSLLETSAGIKAIELGAGCGIASITLSLHYSNIIHLLLTDLSEASEILSHNLSRASASYPSSSNLRSNTGTKNISHQVLDWSLPLPANVQATKWDLVLVADCTYNPDVVPHLVTTLGRIVEGNQECLVCLAMKVRHESEMVFFELMKTRGFQVLESCKLPLPVLGGESEEIEIFMFGNGKV